MTLPRVVAAEALDGLAADDPVAQRSRRDLQRVHRAMGTLGLVRRGWQALGPAARTAPALKVLELGCGDGTLLLSLARKLAPVWPPVRLTLLDRQDIVSAATLRAYTALGWRVSTRVADVLDWAGQDGEPAVAHGRQPWDLISATLFLHHFEDAPLQALLRAVAARCRCFHACEPRRGWVALAGSHLVGALGANRVTRDDAVKSVHAGFRDRELTRLWPAQGPSWQTKESSAGLFSHVFSASRRGPEA